MRYNNQDRLNMSASFPGFHCASIFLTTFVAVATLLDTAAAAAPTNPPSIWQFDILTEPAPAPEDGPPLSASATRDKSLLPAEIGGIVGAYVVFVVFSLGALLTIGRRLRRSAQTSNRSLDVEMMKPTKPPTLNTASPVSPLDRWASPASTTDTKTWPSPAKEKGGWNNMSWSNVSRGHRSQPSQDGSVATFDENVVQSDRQKAQNEMERLYAAVMDHDEKKERMSNASKSPISPTEGPPEFRHLRSPGLAHQQHQQTNQPQQQQQQPSVSFPEEPATNIPPSSPRMSSRLSRLSGLSFLSSSSRSSTANSNKPRPSRLSVRKLPISPPLGSPDVRRAGAYAEDQPLSPRQYTPGPPPPNPSQKARQGSAVSPTSPTMFPSSRHRPSQGTAGSSTSTLPFRSAFSPPQSAPPTKTTILEREEVHRGPRTGMPQTPYSPYMPFTPITPITPSHFVTRRDRRQKEKESGMRVLHEDDMVMSDEDMWGS